MKKYLKYMIFGIVMFLLIGFTNVKAKNLFSCKYQINFSQLLGAADDKETNFTIAITDGKKATVDSSLEKASGTSLFGNWYFSWNKNFDSDFNTLAKKDNSCPSVRFILYGESILGALSSYNDQNAINNKLVNGEIVDSSVQTTTEKTICTRTSELRNQSYEIKITFATKGENKVWKISGNNNDSGYVAYDSPITDAQGNIYTINSSDVSSYFSTKTCKTTPLYLNIEGEISTSVYSMTIQSKKPTATNNGAFAASVSEYDDGIHEDTSTDDKNISTDYVTSCDDIPKTMALIKQIYNVIKFLIPIIIIGLSIVEFLKVLINGEEKIYKESWSKFIKRLIIGVIILILPVILSFVINLSGVISDYGIDKNNIFCIFS